MAASASLSSQANPPNLCGKHSLFLIATKSILFIFAFISPNTAFSRITVETNITFHHHDDDDHHHDDDDDDHDDHHHDVVEKHIDDDDDDKHHSAEAVSVSKSMPVKATVNIIALGEHNCLLLIAPPLP